MNYTQILSLASVITFATLVGEIPTGYLGDKFGHKYSLLLAILFLILENLFFIYANSFMIFILAHICFGLGLAFLSGSNQALIYELLKEQHKEDEMKYWMGKYSSAFYFATFLAPLVGGYIAKDLYNTQFVILILMTIVAQIAGFYLIIMIPNPGIVQKKDKVNILTSSFHILRKNKSLQKLILFQLLASSYLGSFFLLSQPIMKDSNILISFIGIAISIGSITQVFLNLNIKRIEKSGGTNRLLYSSVVISGILFIVFGIVRINYIIFLTFICLMAFTSLKTPLFSHYYNQHIESHHRATTLSIISLITSLYLLIIRPVLGFLMEIDLQLPFIVIGLFMLSSVIIIRLPEEKIVPES